MGRTITLAALALITAAAPLNAVTDPFAWLAAAHDPKAVAWAAGQTTAALDRLTKPPLFLAIEREIRAVESVVEPKPSYALLGRRIVRFARDKANPDGVFSVATRDATGAPTGGWKRVLDVGAMNRAEGGDLKVVFLDLAKQCLPPAFERCLIPFGAGGSSLIQYREFDLATGAFVPGGFRTDPSRGSVAWVDRDTLLIVHGIKPADLLPSGFPRSVYLWKRGTPLAAAPAVFKAAPNDSVVDVMTVRPGTRHPALITLARNYATFEQYLVDRDGRSERLAVPTALQNFGAPFVAGRALVYQLAQDAEIEGRRYRRDTLIAYDFEAAAGQRVSSVYAPSDGTYVNDPFAGIAGIDDGVAFVETAQLRKTLVFATHRAAGWTIRRSVQAPAGVAMTIAAADADGGDVLIDEAGFLAPTRLSLLSAGRARETIYAARPIVDASAYSSEILTARSSDGTTIDYYLVRPRRPRPGPLPVILYGYGGYGVNSDPGYFSGGLGPSLVPWLARGGGYAIAAIRGGSERGSAWAAAAKGTNRQRSFDDFAAVAQDMVARGITAPRRIGCYGRSFGGLLVANMVTQHPDLFGAALIGVPVTDLFGLGGDGDISAGQAIEIGDPKDPAQAPLMRRYSPYQNVRAGVDYPSVLTVVSTADGQVGPGHGRRFTAKLQSVGADAMLIEGPTGGHSFPSEFANSRIFDSQIAFFVRTLMR